LFEEGVASGVGCAVGPADHIVDFGLGAEFGEADAGLRERKVLAERGGGASLDLGFGAAAAAEGPGGVGEVPEELGLDGPVGLDPFVEVGHELLELLLLAGEDDKLPGAEPVRVLFGAERAFSLRG
jgi:hypothetical protein